MTLITLELISLVDLYNRCSRVRTDKLNTVAVVV